VSNPEARIVLGVKAAARQWSEQRARRDGIINIRVAKRQKSISHHGPQAYTSPKHGMVATGPVCCESELGPHAITVLSNNVCPNMSNDRSGCCRRTSILPKVVGRSKASKHGRKYSKPWRARHRLGRYPTACPDIRRIAVAWPFGSDEWPREITCRDA